MHIPEGDIFEYSVAMTPSRPTRQRAANCACAIVTITTPGSIESELSAKTLRNLLEDAGHTVLREAAVKNTHRAIKREIELLGADSLIQSVFTTGGTGIGANDITLEAISPILTKQLDGFGHLFTALVDHSGVCDVLCSRALAGVLDRTAIFCLPHERKVVERTMERLILPHLVMIVNSITE